MIPVVSPIDNNWEQLTAKELILLLYYYFKTDFSKKIA